MAEDLQPTDPPAVGPYQLLKRLGAGGMGQVYLGRSPGGRLVAVKVIRPELSADPGFRARFAREAAAARTVSGVYTAPVVDADPAGPQPWLATAYVPGPSLTEEVSGNGPLAPAAVASLGAGLAEGLQAIHAAGLVHRDLKPSNVLLADDGPRVIDFGISRAVDGSMLTQAGTVLGSPGFLSPEQAEGHEVGPASDVFSLGAVLVFAAAGQGPFGTGTVASLVYRVVNAEPDLSGVPDALRPLLKRCLAKDPASRPTASQLLTELAAAAAADLSWNGRTSTLNTPGPALAASPAATPSPPSPPAPPATAPGQWPVPGQWPSPGYAPSPGQWPVPAGPPGWGPRPPRRYLGENRFFLVTMVMVCILIAVAVPVGIGALKGHQAASGAGSGASATASASAASRAAASRAAASSAAASRAAAGRASARASAASARAEAGASVDGVWAGTYVCNQGTTGVQLSISGSSGGTVMAKVNFFPVASNPGVPDGSYEMVGSYSAAQGLVLNPDYWISQPPGYQMVGLTAAAPRGNSMTGEVQGANCTTFAVRRG